MECRTIKIIRIKQPDGTVNTLRSGACVAATELEGYPDKLVCLSFCGSFVLRTDKFNEYLIPSRRWEAIRRSRLARNSNRPCGVSKGLGRAAVATKIRFRRGN